MASATVNGASLVANYTTNTDSGQIGVSTSSHCNDDTNVFIMTSNSSNNVDNDDNIPQRWTTTGNSDSCRKRASSPSYDDDNKKRRKQSNPVRLATSMTSSSSAAAAGATSTLRNAVKMDDWSRDDDVIHTNRVSSSLNFNAAGSTAAEDFETLNEDDDVMAGDGGSGAAVLPTGSSNLLTRGSLIPTSSATTISPSAAAAMAAVASGGTVSGALSGERGTSCSTLTRIFNPEAFCELSSHHPANYSPNGINSSNNNNNGNRNQRRSSSGVGPSPPLPPLESGAVQTSPTPSVREIQNQMSAMMAGTSVNLGMLSNKVLPVMNLEAFCDICQKEFCNKYFLKKHRQKIHGIQDPPSLTSSPAVSAAVMANSISALVDSMAAAAAAGATTDLFYEYSARDLSAKIAAATQQSAKHSIQNLMGVPGSKSGTGSQNGNNSIAGGQGEVAVFNAVGGNGGCSPSGESGRWVPGSITVAGHVFTPERLREMGVINVDAFCEICCKEFCNKYFLRTHKMNKHGVGVVGNEFPLPPSSSCTSLIKSPSSSSGHGGAGGNGHQQQQQPLSLVVDKDSCHQMAEQDGGSRKSINSPGSSHSGSSYGRSMTNVGASTTPVEHPTSPLISGSNQIDSSQETGNGTGTQGDLICEVCSRPFSSTYLLKMHKFYFHNPSSLAAANALGVTEAQASVISALATSSLIEEHIAAAEAMRRQCASGGGESSNGDEAALGRNGTGNGPISDELQKLQSMIRELNTSPSAVAAAAKDCSEVRCSICLKEMKNKYFLRAHMMNEHGELHNEEADTSPAECFNMAMLKTEPEDYSDTGGGRATATPTKSSTSSEQTTPTNDGGSTFCDICGKDFCSKYFLRAHQLTSHAHEVQIKQELNPLNLNQMLLSDRIKMESVAANMAAIQPSPLPPQLPPSMLNPLAMTASGTPNAERSGVTGRNFCEICNKELCNKYFMKTHMLKMHGINVDDKIHSGSVNGATIGGVMISSSLQLQRPPSLSSSSQQQQNLSLNLSSPRDYLSESTAAISPNKGWLSNLYAHEKRHTGLSNEGEKRFSCRVCHRAYRYNHSLQRHLVSHKTTGILFKHVMSAAAANNGTNMAANMYHHHQITSSNMAEHHNQELHHQSSMKQQQDVSMNLNKIRQFKSQDYQMKHIQDSDNEEKLGQEVDLSKRSKLMSETTSKKIPLKVKKYRCSKCGAKYRSREQCLEHIHQHHSSNNRFRSRYRNSFVKSSTTLRCSHCDFSCVTSETMAAHVNTHHNSVAQSEHHNLNEDNNSEPEMELGEYNSKAKHFADNNESDVTDDETTMQLKQYGGVVGGQQQGQSHLPMTYAVPQAPPTAGTATPLGTAETASGGAGSGRMDVKSPNNNVATFVPSLVYLPVSRKVNDSLTVTFNLIPA
ncbi:hypothetical protein CHUAL_006327 [Chamberlinius hualienensis]